MSLLPCLSRGAAGCGRSPRSSCPPVHLRADLSTSTAFGRLGASHRRWRCRIVPTASLSGDAAGAVSDSASTSAPAQPVPEPAAEASSSGKTELQTLIDAIPFTRLAIWALFGLGVYQLHDFAGIVLGTFIVSFIGNSFIGNTQNTSLMQSLVPNPQTRRRCLAVVYFLSILSVVTLFGVLTIPDIAKEGADFVNRLQSDNIWVILVEKTRRGLGDQVMNSLEKAVYLATSNDIAAAAVHDTGVWTAERSTQLGLAVASMLKNYTTTAAKYTGLFIKSVAKFGLQAFVSLVLGFMFVWDMPSISAGVATMRSSRLAPVYAEVAPMLAVFGRLFGKALEVQAQIALVNTALTAAGLWLLAIPGIGLLSLFVFMCSFIPIMGCIMSTVPIGFVALTEYGFIKLALVIVMVLVVHFVEAYALNPAIYSANLKLHPLMVLSVLLIAEHNIGVWGLMMAVPLTVFALDYIVKYPKSSVKEVGQREVKALERASGQQPSASASSAPA